MKQRILILMAVCATTVTSWAQLSTDQKVQDFQSLSALFAKQYAPDNWKIQEFNIDVLKVAPWLDQIRKSKDDIEFYEIMAKYVANLNDVHSSYSNPSDFVADLRFRVDIYDGKVLIDAIDRAALPSSKFPFTTGDELVMVDGKTTDEYIKNFATLVALANPVTTARYDVQLIPIRVQAYIPRAEEVGDTATVVVRSRLSGNLATYTIPWVKTGTPLTQNGPVPTPQAAQRESASLALDDIRGNDPQWYLHPLNYAQGRMNPHHKFMQKMVLNFGSTTPIFALPAGFVTRLNGRGSSYFLTGTYKAGGKTIGYIRIADFEPVSDFTLLDIPESQFDREITFMQANTDGLVVDVMRNPGGFGCYAEDLMSRLAVKPFYGLNLEFRPLIADVQSFNQAVKDAIDFGADQWKIDTLKAYQAEILQAFKEVRGVTGPLPVCGFSDKRDPHTPAVYNKPILLLTDHFTISAGDFFSAMFQDAQRGKIYGTRTSGAGGSIFGYNTGFFSEGSATVTQTLGVRQNPVVTSDYPTAPFIENIGVRPDIQADYMTLDNFLQRGKPFTDGFTQAILDMIAGK